MGTNDINIATGEVVAKYVNTDEINRSIQERIAVLSGELNPEAAAQLVADGNKLETVVEGHGNSVSGKNVLKESYLIEYLKQHDIPVSGGDGGTAHNVDGSPYSSKVPIQLQGNELESLMLPIIDVKTEADNYLNIVFKDKVEEAATNAAGEIKELITPTVKEMVANEIGGMLK